MGAKRQTFEEVIARIEKAENGCWYLGPPPYRRYPTVNVERKRYHCGRLLYERLRGPIEPGKELHHACPTVADPACINPWHLQQLSHIEHMQTHRPPHPPPETIIRERKPYCLRGHAFTPGNTRYYGGGRRQCRLCDKVRRDRGRDARLQGIKLDPHKLTPEQRAEVLRGYPNEGSGHFWAKRFGVHASTIMKVIHDAGRQAEPSRKKV